MTVTPFASPTVSSRRFSPAKRPSACAASSTERRAQNRRDGRQRVQDIVAAGNRKPHFVMLAVGLDREGNAVGASCRSLPMNVGAGLSKPKPTTFRRQRVGERAGFGIVEVEHRLSRRSRKPANRLRKLVHLLVIEADVGQHRELGPVEGDRAVALVDLADEQLGVADQRAGEGRGGRDEILHHRAVHHRRLAVAGVEDPADHAGNGRLAARAADGDAALRGVEQLGEELRAGEVR